MTELDHEERSNLLRLARTSILQAILGEDVLSTLLAQIEITPRLSRACGVFVSLKQPGAGRGGKEGLRGCIGTLSAEHALYKNVIDLAPRSATEDPRFRPVSAEELPGLRIELSVLGPMGPPAAAGDLVVGRDGVQLKKGSARAVFLPQVAVEHGWTVETLLRQLSLKAGLTENAWRDAELNLFQAEVFREPN